MTALIHTMTSLPYKQFRQNRHFYLWYDGTWALLLLAGIGLMAATSFRGIGPEFSPWFLLAFPFVLYTQIMGHVFVHNATHKAWPRSINRLVGEICGAWVVTRFASWEVVHQRHHIYSENAEKDPHPVIPGFWRYAWRTIFTVEEQLQKAYYDSFGDTPENRRYEKLRAVVSFGTGVLLLSFWLMLLGPAFFSAVFIPCAVLGGIFIFHFNWATHNGFSPIHDFRPVNLDHGLYWLGNRLFFGIYFHANHHKRPGVFNPRHMPNSLPIEPAHPSTEKQAA
ncbi:MAG: fatty acid desaturase [Myxococcota bacterium]